MNVRVQFFAQLRDLAGAEAVEINLPEKSTVSDLLEKIYEQKPSLRASDTTTLIGVGVEFVGRDYQLGPNELVAIMPPVQGG
jgi:molybdopterin converting factor small subunit